MTTLNLNNIAIVLVETISPGNIGAVARATKNMGISDLRLVKPKRDPFGEEARKLAHGAIDTLEASKVFPSIEEATKDCSTVVATSHDTIRYKLQSYSVREIGQHLIPYTVNNKVAILFGREDIGLHNEEIKKCSFLVNIPTFRNYPAINLSKAVMLTCYELFMTTQQQTQAPQYPKLVDQNKMENFYEVVLRMINSAGFRHKNNDSSIFMGSLRRIFGRTGLDEHEMAILIKLFSQFTYVERKND
ncbi:RNA methyltransferase [Candidatus Uabimicrobium amorphum]|uniref:tRNA (cytidine/uridine-2'-O-)-methyltransferase TrmJ n=1 Tax=Uabimicrobium amorphum TaxID=2596890 RepID=A0A5S9F4D3_UABAM|nr:RNA methyltransferase [Candidatus Uabimicrobium amorphum]BBM85687.1 tRNA (cytidine/uridine-2'-O-)-methyltransferaseTrmJ [Candidatus Uabimicrobium amorphum]